MLAANRAVLEYTAPKHDLTSAICRATAAQEATTTECSSHETGRARYQKVLHITRHIRQLLIAIIRNLHDIDLSRRAVPLASTRRKLFGSAGGSLLRPHPCRPCVLLQNRASSSRRRMATGRGIGRDVFASAIVLIIIVIIVIIPTLRLIFIVRVAFLDIVLGL
jgi:hypothetical protein